MVEIVDDLDIDSIDPLKSMRDYVSDSLDVVEVVSCTMRELKIRVPRSELADIGTINELAGKLHQYVEAQ
ncbi:MAG: phosphopantetheine-binding protein [Chloroflexota bacterium]|nr:phosphopantetheine-binding protein [Chloroflexota bacterium]